MGLEMYQLFCFGSIKFIPFFADNVSVIGQRWNYPSNEKIIDFVQETICYANQINT